MSRISDQLHIISNHLQMKVWFYGVWIAARSNVYHWILSVTYCTHEYQMIAPHQLRPRDDAGHKHVHKFAIYQCPCHSKCCSSTVCPTHQVVRDGELIELCTSAPRVWFQFSLPNTAWLLVASSRGFKHAPNWEQGESHV